MARPYSDDLRERVVAAVLENGLSCPRTAARFDIAVSTAVMFKVLILAVQNSVNDARMEYLIRDRLSWLWPAAGFVDTEISWTPR